MNNRHYRFAATRILSVWMAASLLLMIGACARKMAFSTSTVVPAATGKAKVKKDHNGNYGIDVSVRNLAPADKLTPARERYIVWVETEANGVKNIGQFNPSGNKLKASLNANLPFKPKHFFITAEDDQNIQYPGSTVVLTTQ